MRKLLFKIVAGTGITVLTLAGILGAVWVFLTSVIGISDDSHLNKKWSVNSPDTLTKKSIANDVWHWYDVHGIKPESITRVDWSKTNFLGLTKGGYFIYFKGRVIDTEIEKIILDNKDQFLAYSELPHFASRPPMWWKPQFKIPKNFNIGVLNSVDYIYFSLRNDILYIYWLKFPWEGRIHASKTPVGVKIVNML